MDLPGSLDQTAYWHMPNESSFLTNKHIYGTQSHKTKRQAHLLHVQNYKIDFMQIWT